MSTRSRGQEQHLRFIFDGVPRTGSWEKIEDFEATPMGEIKATNFVGESRTDFDTQYDGFTLSWTQHMLDAETLDYLDQAMGLDEDGDAPADVQVQVLYKFRTPGERARVVTYHGVSVMPGAEGFRGRKEFVTTKFEAKCGYRTTKIL